jgi:hypothetical protein
MPFNSEELEELMKSDVATLKEFLEKYEKKLDDASIKQINLIIASKLDIAMPIAPDRPMPRKAQASQKAREMEKMFRDVYAETYRRVYMSNIIENINPDEADRLAKLNAIQNAEYAVRAANLRGKKRRRKSKNGKKKHGGRKSKVSKKRKNRKSTMKAVHS